MKLKISFLFILFILLSFTSYSSTSKVIYSNDKWQLYFNDQAFYINGLTFGVKFDEKNIDNYMKDLSSLGCNTIRTWGVGDETKLLLDSAQKYGIKVMLGLWLRHGRAGMEGDDAFDWVGDSEGKVAQWNDAIKAVKKYKDHPALLMWGVGNEVILNIGSDPEKIAYSKFLESLCKEIKKIDGNHLISSASAWTIDAAYWAKYVPSIDVYGLNVYGGGASIIDSEVKKLGVDKPYILTEYGVTGEWEVKKDSNGLPTEPNDTQKFDIIGKGWKDFLKSKNTCLGGFVFNYGNGWDHGSIWLSLLMDEYHRPQYWATKKAFTEDESIINPIEINKFEIPNNCTQNEWIPVAANSTPSIEKLKISMYFNQRTGSREHKDSIFPLEIKEEKGITYFKAPKVLGPIKIYLFLTDDKKNLAIAQQSIDISSKGDNVESTNNKNIKEVIYDEDTKLTGIIPKYISSGLMGDSNLLLLDFSNRENPYKGETSLKVTFNSKKGWVGCAWQNPYDNWGNKKGGINLTGAKKLTFWARGLTGGEKVNFSYGIVDKGSASRDSSKGETGDIYLTDEWTKYTINLNKKDLSNIITGFCFFTSSSGEPITFYLDEIQYE